MKHSIKSLLLTVLVAFVSVSASAYDFEVDGIFYNVVSISDLTCEVTYGGDSENSALYTGNVKIPSTVTYSGKNLSVTSIGYHAFYHCESLTSVNIPSSVTSIGYYAFYDCTSLTSINIPNSVTSIGYYAFGFCKSLTSVKIPNSVTSIGESAFYDCTSLISIDIPNSVTSIGDEAFSYCKSLTSVNIPNSVTEIGALAVSPSGIKEIVIGTGIKSLPCKFTSKHKEQYGIEYDEYYISTLFAQFSLHYYEGFYYNYEKSSSTCNSLKKNRYTR